MPATLNTLTDEETEQLVKSSCGMQGEFDDWEHTQNDAVCTASLEELRHIELQSLGQDSVLAGRVRTLVIEYEIDEDVHNLICFRHVAVRSMYETFLTFPNIDAIVFHRPRLPIDRLGRFERFSFTETFAIVMEALERSGLQPKRLLLDPFPRRYSAGVPTYVPHCELGCLATVHNCLKNVRLFEYGVHYQRESDDSADEHDRLREEIVGGLNKMSAVRELRLVFAQSEAAFCIFGALASDMALPHLTNLELLDVVCTEDSMIAMLNRHRPTLRCLDIMKVEFVWLESGETWHGRQLLRKLYLHFDLELIKLRHLISSCKGVITFAGAGDDVVSSVEAEGKATVKAALGDAMLSMSYRSNPVPSAMWIVSHDA